MKCYYMAATAHEGCGHRHRSPRTARPCLQKVNGRRPRIGHVSYPYGKFVFREVK